MNKTVTIQISINSHGFTSAIYNNFVCVVILNFLSHYDTIQQ
jgi:hypothetical protein